MKIIHTSDGKITEIDGCNSFDFVFRYFVEQTKGSMRLSLAIKDGADGVTKFTVNPKHLNIWADVYPGNYAGEIRHE